MEELSQKEKDAIKVLEEAGWQIITGAHLEDWDEGQIVKTEYNNEDIEVRSEIAIIKC